MFRENYKVISSFTIIIIVAFILTVLTVIVFFTKISKETETIPSFRFRRPITINNTLNLNTLTDYQVLVTIDTASLISAGKMRSDCGDIRFTDSDGTTLLNYWLESGCDSTNTKIWVKVPNIPASSTKTIYVYYGNPGATNIGAIWYNLKHLNIQNGVFNYNASLGVGGYYSREMQHRLGVAAGAYHTCILKSNGNVDCYGNNLFGQANNYTGGDAIGVAAGAYHTCILKSNGNVNCYEEEENEYVEANDYFERDAIGVAEGALHTCVLKSNGNVDCYGRDPIDKTNDYLGGDAIGVAAGAYHTCILKSNGNVDCYGNNYYGQANDYTGGDAKSPFRKYTSPEPTTSVGAEETI